MNLQDQLKKAQEQFAKEGVHDKDGSYIVEPTAPMQPPAPLAGGTEEKRGYGPKAEPPTHPYPAPATADQPPSSHPDYLIGDYGEKIPVAALNAALEFSNALAEVAAGCKEGRPVSPATAWVPIVVCAALRKEGQLVIGIRHHDLLMRATISATFGSRWWKDAEQGFVNAKGQFLTRQEAHVVAKQNNQIRRRCGGDEHELYSENLY